MTASALAQERRIPQAEACRRLGISLDGLKKIIRAGRLTVIHVPGCHPRVLASEVDELLTASVTPRRTG